LVRPELVQDGVQLTLMSKPVVVVGAGLAGLVCARHLHQAGVPVIVVDAEDEPGGKLRTDHVGGFTLDRGFQVLFTAYPNLNREVNVEELKPGAFAKGAYIYHQNSLKLLAPQPFIEMFKQRLGILRDKTVPFADKRRLASLAESVNQQSPRQNLSANLMTAEDYLYDRGFGDEAMDRFFRPFFGGIFLDRSLSVDSRQFGFVWTMLTQGNTILPTGGMQAVAEQIASGIPRYLFRMGNRVSEVMYGSSGQVEGVRFNTTEVLSASRVVIATDAEEAARLVGQPITTEFKSSTCLYFEIPKPLVEGPYIILNGSGNGVVNHIAPVSAANPSYAPHGKHLVSVTVLGVPEMNDDQLAQTVKEEVSAWSPEIGAYMWRFIRAYRIRNAQLAQPVGFIEHLPNNATQHNNLYWAGEFTENSSIDGAIRSGLDCARMILSQQGAAEAA